MVGASYFCTTQAEMEPRVFGWAGVGLFGLALVVIPLRMFRKGAQLIINDEGIDDRRLKLGMIPWADISDVSIGAVRSTKFLCVQLVDKNKYFSRLPKWKVALMSANEALGFPGLTLNFSGLTPGVREAWAYIEARKRARLTPRASGAPIAHR